MIHIKTVTAKDGGTYKEIIDDGKPNFIEQRIVSVGKDMLKVISQQGNEYWVAMSDKVLMTMTPKQNDIAVIGTFKEKWVVTDIIKCSKENDDVLDENELLKQLKAFESLCGGY